MVPGVLDNLWQYRVLAHWKVSDPSIGGLLWSHISQSRNKNQLKEREQIFKNKTKTQKKPQTTPCGNVSTSVTPTILLEAASGHWSELSPNTADHGNDEEKQWPKQAESTMGSRRAWFQALPVFPACYTSLSLPLLSYRISDGPYCCYCAESKGLAY